MFNPLNLLKVLFAFALTMLGLTAHAEVPAGVLTAITGAVTDVGTIGAAVLLVVVAIAGFIWLKKPIH